MTIPCFRLHTWPLGPVGNSRQQDLVERCGGARHPSERFFEMHSVRPACLTSIRTVSANSCPTWRACLQERRRLQSVEPEPRSRRCTHHVLQLWGGRHRTASGNHTQPRRARTEPRGCIQTSSGHGGRGCEARVSSIAGRTRRPIGRRRCVS